MLKRLIVWLAKRELDASFKAMRKNSHITNVVRYAYATRRYYEAKYGPMGSGF